MLYYDNRDIMFRLLSQFYDNKWLTMFFIKRDDVSQSSLTWNVLEFEKTSLIILSLW
jgi:hypothetical protein